MKLSEVRALTSYEKRLINRLLEEEFPGRDAILEQIKSSQARQIDAHGCLEFRVGTDLPAVTRFRVPVEGEFEDVDGVTIHILLHIVDEKAKTLEIFKEDLSEVIRLPEPEHLRLFHPS